MWMDSGFGMGMGWAWLFLALLVVGVVLLVVVLVRTLSGGSGGGDKRPPDSDHRRALDLLDERYARGEIGTEEYEERRRNLGRNPGA